MVVRKDGIIVVQPPKFDSGKLERLRKFDGFLEKIVDILRCSKFRPRRPIGLSSAIRDTVSGGVENDGRRDDTHHSTKKYRHFAARLVL